MLDAVASRATLPLVVHNDDGVGNGTGVFLDVAGSPFVLTAAHVVKEAAKKNARFWIPGPRGDLHLGTFKIRATDENTIEDTCVIEVPPELHARLVGDGFRPATMAEIDPYYPHTPWPPTTLDDLLCPVGFPLVRQEYEQHGGEWKVKPIRNMLTLVPRGADGLEQCRTEPFDPSKEFFLLYPEVADGVPALYHADGSTSEGFDPGGFSGSGVWTLPTHRGLAWQPSDVRLVGIVRGYCETLNMLTVTRIAIHLSVVATIKELVAPLSLSVERHPIISPASVPLDELLAMLGFRPPKR